MSQLCHVCGLATTTGCGRCQRAYYCGTECQLRDWHQGGHKRECFDAHAAHDGLQLAREIFTDLETRAPDLGEEALDKGHELVEELAMEHIMTEFFMENPDLIEEALSDPDLQPIAVDEEMPENIDARAEALLWLDCHRIGGSIAHDVHTPASEYEVVGAALGATPELPISLLIGQDYAERVRSVTETDREWYARVDNAFTDKLRDAWEKVKEGGRKAAEAVKRGAQKVWEGAKRGASKAWEATKRGASKAWEAAKKGAQKAKEGLQKGAAAVKRGAQRAWAATKRGAARAKAAIVKKGQALAKTLREKKAQLVDKIRAKKQQLAESWAKRRQRASERREINRQKRQQNQERRAEQKQARDSQRQQQREEKAQRDADSQAQRQQQESDRAAQRQQQQEEKAQRDADRAARRQQEAEDKAARDAARREQQEQDRLRRDEEARLKQQRDQEMRDRRDRENQIQRERAAREEMARQDAERRRQEQAEYDRRRRQDEQDAARRAAEAERRAQTIVIAPASPPVPRVVYRPSIPPAPTVPIIVAPPRVIDLAERPLLTSPAAITEVNSVRLSLERQGNLLNSVLRYRPPVSETTEQALRDVGHLLSLADAQLGALAGKTTPSQSSDMRTTPAEAITEAERHLRQDVQRLQDLQKRDGTISIVAMRGLNNAMADMNEAIEVLAQISLNN